MAGGCERTVIRLRMPVFELGPKFVADPLLGPVEQGETLRRLIEALQEAQRDCVMFVFPRLSAASFEQLASAARSLGLPWRWQWSSYAYAFDTTIRLDDFLARLDGKQRRELGRRSRRLAKDHACEFVAEEGLDVEDDMQRFETFITLEDSGGRERTGPRSHVARATSPTFVSWYGAHHCGRQLAWYTLRADNRPIAMYLALRTHDTLWLPKIGYDERFAAHAPGMVLSHHVLTGMHRERRYPSGRQPQCRAVGTAVEARSDPLQVDDALQPSPAFDARVQGAGNEASGAAPRSGGPRSCRDRTNGRISRAAYAAVNPRYPSPTLADAFRGRAHSLRDRHQPGSVRFTWNARGALYQLLTALPERRGATVLVPAYHCVALTQAPRRRGLHDLAATACGRTSRLTWKISRRGCTPTWQPSW